MYDSPAASKHGNVDMPSAMAWSDPSPPFSLELTQSLQKLLTYDRILYPL